MGRTKRKDHRGFRPHRSDSERRLRAVNAEAWSDNEFDDSDEAFFDTDDRPSNYPRVTADLDLLDDDAWSEDRSLDDVREFVSRKSR